MTSSNDPNLRLIEETFVKTMDLPDGQRAELTLILSGKVVAASEGNSNARYLWISLENSFIKPTLNANSALAFDQNDKRGWFTEWIDVKMWLENAQGGALVIESQPKTPPSQYVFTSSITGSIDPSGGWFGGTHTGNAGMGISVGSSISHTLLDFGFVDNTENSTVTDQAWHSGIVEHSYKLVATDAGPYTGPSSLVPTGLDPKTLIGSPLYDVPPLAKADFPLIDQAVFRCPALPILDAEVVQTDARLHVVVTFGYAFVEKTWNPASLATPTPSVLIEPKRQNQSVAFIWVAPFGQMGAGSGGKVDPSKNPVTS